jgi:hypothetical protein
MDTIERQQTEGRGSSIGVRTDAQDGLAASEATPYWIFETALNALAEWRPALGAGIVVAAGAWLLTTGRRNSDALEFLVRPPVEALGELRSAVDAAKAIESCSVPATVGDGFLKITARTDKNGELIAVSTLVRHGIDRDQASAEASRIVGEITRALKPSMDRAAESIARAIATVDGSIAETQHLIGSRNSNTVDQADTVALLNSQISAMKNTRDDLVRRQAAAGRIAIVGDVKLVEPGITSAAFIAPPVAGAAAFVACAFVVQGFRAARRSIARAR